MVSIGLYYCYILLSSADCLYIIIYIGHIADSSKPYRYRLVSASAEIAPSAVLSTVYISCQLQDQTDWHARISSTFGPTLELSRSPRPVCIFRVKTSPPSPTLVRSSPASPAQAPTPPSPPTVQASLLKVHLGLLNCFGVNDNTIRGSLMLFVEMNARIKRSGT